MWYHQQAASSLPANYRFSSLCRFCSTPLRTDDIELRKIIRQLNELNEDIKLYPGSNREQVIPQLAIGVCPACGWWKHEVDFRFSEYPPSNNYHVRQGELRALDVADLTVPIDELRRYLVARYEDRFEVDWRRMEDIVREIFRDFGYSALGCGYQDDGGLDVLLTGTTGNTIGVQVKRYRNTIAVEQIRAFLGALVLNENTEGIFVTTSDFSPDANEAAEKAASHGHAIKLMNATELLAALKIANIRSYENSDMKKPWELKDFSIY